MKWHKYPDEKPGDGEKYLVCLKYRFIEHHLYYSVCGYKKNLCSLDEFDFHYLEKAKDKSGFYGYDDFKSRHYKVNDVIAWAEIPEYKEGKDDE